MIEMKGASYEIKVPGGYTVPWYQKTGIYTVDGAEIINSWKMDPYRSTNLRKLRRDQYYYWIGKTRADSKKLRKVITKAKNK